MTVLCFLRAHCFWVVETKISLCALGCYLVRVRGADVWFRLTQLPWPRRYRGLCQSRPIAWGETKRRLFERIHDSGPGGLSWLPSLHTLCDHWELQSYYVAAWIWDIGRKKKYLVGGDKVSTAVAPGLKICLNCKMLSEAHKNLLWRHYCRVDRCWQEEIVTAYLNLCSKCEFVKYFCIRST